MGFSIVYVEGGGLNGSWGFTEGLLGLMSVRGPLGFFFFFFFFYFFLFFFFFFFFFFVFHCLASVLVCPFLPTQNQQEGKKGTSIVYVEGGGG